MKADSGNQKKKIVKADRDSKQIAMLLGLGLDNKDGHVRITSGSNFRLLGGSEDTHETMQETAIKLNEELFRRGKRLEDVDPNEFLDILRKIR